MHGGMQGEYHAQDGGDATADRGGGVRLAGAAAAALAGAEVERGVQLSCGEHSDYGLLTLVNQDAHIPALQVQIVFTLIACSRFLSPVSYIVPID